jgi:hypothetical protein
VTGFKTNQHAGLGLTPDRECARMGRVEARDGVEPPKKGFADLPLAAWVPRHREQMRVLLPAMIIYRKAKSNHRSMHA